MNTAGTARILVIDDEPIVTGSMQRLLQEYGYSVSAFNDCCAAIGYYQKNWKSFDLIILDMNMPDFRGREAFEALKRANENARVLLCSGYAANGESATLLESGACGFLQKPFKGVLLIEKIREVLSE